MEPYENSFLADPSLAFGMTTGAVVHPRPSRAISPVCHPEKTASALRRGIGQGIFFTRLHIRECYPSALSRSLTDVRDDKIDWAVHAPYPHRRPILSFRRGRRQPDAEKSAHGHSSRVSISGKVKTIFIVIPRKQSRRCFLGIGQGIIFARFHISKRYWVPSGGSLRENFVFTTR